MKFRVQFILNWKIQAVEAGERRLQMGSDKGRTEARHSAGKEQCVLCGRLTETAKEQPVYKREHYIEGAGQLCRKCYQELYAPRHNADVVQLAGQNMPDKRYL